jgi:beta-glucosidase
LLPGRPRDLWHASATPVYPFGYGLSYTQFKYSGLHLANAVMKDDDHNYVEVTVTNTGKIQGDEVVQMYIHDEVSSLTRPLLELKGFARITLNPGESKQVRMPITRRSLEFWKAGKWITEAGDFSVMVGTNSTELNKIKLTLIK